ncbi:MAG TPA: DUF1616 domain-containing protein [Solirubrobacterales bacterium]
MRGHRDLELATIAAIVCALVASLVPWEVVRLVAALPLAVFLPGYAIVTAAFGPRRLDRERLSMLSLACGLSVLCLGGLVLNYLPGGLRTWTWALLLVLVVVAACRVAALRRPRAEETREPLPRLRLRRVDLVCGLLALAAAVAALTLAYTPLPAGDASGYTALWMLPDAEEPDSYVRVGVVSAEQGGERYRLQVRAGKSRSLKIYHLALDPGGERVFRVPVQVGATGTTRVAASLYEQARPHALYRRVTTWLRPGTAAP